MYAVSDEYKLAVADSHRKSKMRAVLTIGSTVINIDDNDIIKDSVYVTNQCTNGNEYEYGCVYAAECGITIKSAVDRYALYDAELKLYWSLWTGTAWEEIPLGVFYISEPNRINDKINIKALDGMTKLDVNVDEDTQGTMPQLVVYIAEKCGVELAQTAEELSTFTNSEYMLSLHEDSVETYRDALAFICMLSACFATFDRYGKLKLVPYATEPCVELGRNHRFKNATFSDYETSFIGVRSRFIAEENYYPYEVGEEGTGLILDMGDNPVLRGLPEIKNEILSNVYDVLKNVKYTPFEMETLGNPALDLGDYVKNVGVGNDSKTYLSPITYYYWTYRGKHKLRAVGGNPKLAGVVNRQGKQINSLESAINSKTIIVKEYRNADAISFSSKDTEIARINFSATENSKPIMLLCVRFATNLDGILVIQFYTDGALDSERTFRKYVSRGEHIITLSDVYNVDTNDRKTILIMAKMEYFESDSRKHDADAKTHNNFLDALKNTGATVADNVVQFPAYDVAAIDTTIATATIKKGEVCAVLYGQGIAGEGKWDGTINFTEKFSGVAFTRLPISDLVDSIESKFHNPTRTGFSEVLSGTAFSGLSFGNISGGVSGGVTDSITVSKVIVDYVFNATYSENYTFDKYITTNNDMFALKTIYNYESVEEPIDSGKMCSVAIDYTGIDVESVVVKNEYS